MKTGLIRIGTRGSALALKQVELVSTALKEKVPGLTIEIEIITTKGDVNQAPIPVDTVGKAWFTAEIEEALLERRIDLAVHSLKDMPPEVPDGLLVLPVCAREDARDALVSNGNILLKDLKHGAIVGTDSVRRKALLHQKRPDLDVRSVRGNVQTRLQKLADGQYDALVLAAAGLIRLDLANVIAEYFDPSEFIPAIGQGVLAAECAIEDAGLLELLTSIQDKSTRITTESEQTFSTIVGGGCKLPVGCYAQIDGEQILIHGMIGDDDASHLVIGSIEGPMIEGPLLAKQLAQELQERLK